MTCWRAGETVPMSRFWWRVVGMRFMGVKRVRVLPPHKTSAIVPEAYPCATRAILAVNLTLAVIILLLARPVSAQGGDPFEECARQLSSPPINQISLNTDRNALPIISTEDASRFVGLVCSRDLVVQFLESLGLILNREANFNPSNGHSEIDRQYSFCYPNKGWKRIVLGQCSDLLLVGSLNNKIITIGFFGAK